MEERCRGTGGDIRDTHHHRRRHRRRTSISPDRGKAVAPPPQPPMKKVQVFYYLTRNGCLEQPHFVEIALFPSQPLRLKDVLDRLAVLRGKAMPSLYSWSCKRNYKSGYVWNDLSENDVVYPAEGSEYVLKGSELLDSSPEKLQQIHIRSSNNNRQPVQEPNLGNKTRKEQLGPSPLRELDDRVHPDSDLEYDEVEDYEYDDGEKPIYTTTPHSRCSRGVSTTTEEQEPPGPTRPPTRTPTESARFSTSKRFTSDDDLEELGSESAPSRNSVLLQFIACGGGSAGSREPARRTEKGLGKGVVCKMAGKMIGGEEEMIKYMSENPRFGKLQTEEKEYFSGSIVESIREEDRHVGEPVLKKSTSYNQEKSKREELGEKRDFDDEEKRLEEEDNNGGMKGRCIPRMIMISTSSKLQPTKNKHSQ